MRLTRRGRLIVTVVVAAALIAAAVFAVTRTPLGPLLGLGSAPPCTLDTGAEEIDWSAQEAMTATTVTGVGVRIGASENGVAAAVRRALEPDRATPLSPAAARQVYRLLPDVAHPDAAELAVARALLGSRGPALTCIVPLIGDDLPRQQLGPNGLTPRAESVRVALRESFGPQSLGGFAPGGVSGGHVEGSAHYEGRAIDVFFRPVTPANTRGGWTVALWAVAHAEELDLDTVIFDRQIWSSDRSAEGWRRYRYPGGKTDNPVLLHEDHVHVDVVRGD